MFGCSFAYTCVGFGVTLCLCNLDHMAKVLFLAAMVRPCHLLARIRHRKCSSYSQGFSHLWVEKKTEGKEWHQVMCSLVCTAFITNPEGRVGCTKLCGRIRSFIRYLWGLWVRYLCDKRTNSSKFFCSLCMLCKNDPCISKKEFFWCLVLQMTSLGNNNVTHRWFLKCILCSFFFITFPFLLTAVRVVWWQSFREREK